ncbi:HYC_CC_PP family protein [Chitinophaga sancti]|uniref:Uncharacterized protein n=1 Tax=Chitinophaga sancti TaxID=1004 RepID=A0A1K1S0P3_9BACT|nr:hypothetical protein [Chitinophaga sancti]WQD59745.1 hypothetical protein U0033_17795 [Chitinophaga sancti]WQG88124.1 hypothetical protein SR876_24670 [Chitinophaga sancti]SFW78000.1 hypothetical protein SAMN05661012_04556 [Chitinophaga sancti]
MKRVTAICLLLLYSLTLVGLGVKQFYCCGKLKEVSLGLASAAEHHCDMDKQHKGCCETAFKTLKVEDSHFSATDVNIPATFFFTLANLQLNNWHIEPVLDQPFHFNYGNGPPLYNSTPIYILNCIYRV